MVIDARNADFRNAEVLQVFAIGSKTCNAINAIFLD